MLASAFEIYSQAQDGQYGIGAFNTSNVEIMKAIVSAAVEMNSPVVIETSEGEMDFLGPEVMAAAFQELVEDLSIPAALHLDHGKSLDSVRQALEAGYTSVHLDGSDLDYEENVALTKQVVELTAGKDILVEGEIDKIRGKSYVHEGKFEGESKLTNPVQAQDFVSRTGIGCLAVSIGNVHGVFSQPPQLDFERLSQIKKAVGCFVSLHGGSGIRDEDLQEAIRRGVTKINVNTELRQAYAEGLGVNFQAGQPASIVPYKYLPQAMEKVGEVVRGKMGVFGSEGKV